MNRIFLFLLLSLAATSVLAAPTPPQADAHRMAMRGLEFLRGEWVVESFSKSKDGSWQANEQGAFNIQERFGARYLEAESHLQNADFRITFGYDQMRKQYLLLLLDSGTGAIDLYRGIQTEDGTFLLTNDHGYRWELRRHPDNTVEMLYQASKDGGQNWQSFGRHILRR